MLVQPHAAPWDGAEGLRQQKLGVSNAAQLAIGFADDGGDVVIADVVNSEQVPVLLVLHGASGVPDADLVAAVRAGMTKVNITTHLTNAFTSALRRHLADRPSVVDTRLYMGAGRDAVETEAARLQELLAMR